MKKSLLFIALLTATFSWGQFEILSIDRDNDNYCSGESKSILIKVKHTGFAAPSLVVSSNSNQGYLNIVENNSTFYTDTIDFNIDVTDLYIVAMDAVEDDSLEFSFLTSLGSPIPALDTLVEVVVNGYFDVFVDLNGTILCTNGQPIDLNQFASIPGGDYEFYGDAPNSNIFNPTAYYQNTANTFLYFDYSVTNSNGCIGYAVEPYLSLDFPPTTVVSTTPSSCGSAIGDATVNITPGDATGPMKVYWSTGFLDPAVSSISSISNLSSGVYYANITDVSGCKAVGTAKIGDADIVVTDVITSETCLGMNNGTIDLTISTTGNITQTFWSNGATTEDMTGHAGEYSVEIHTDNNCNSFGTYTIPISNLAVNGVNVNHNDCMQMVPGSIDLTTIGGTSPYSWNWTKLGDATWTDPLTEDISNLDPGVYTCTITDDVGCQYEWSKTIQSFGGNANVYTNSVIKENCGQSNGAIDVEIGSGNISSWNWSNGATTEDLTNLTAGDYSLEYTDDFGCTNVLTTTVMNALPYQPQICLLTVDQSLVYNQIVWEKDPNNIVDGFNIYRETSNYGIFELVTSLPYSHESAYIDNAASPVDRSWRYFITSYDACGESYGSFIHKTIHIVETSNNGTEIDLAWDDYEGITYSSIDLMRFDATNGWQQVANLPIGTNNYTDTPPVFTDIDYMISFNLSSPCTSTKAQDHNASRSNTSSSAFNAGDPTDLSVIEKEDGKITLYPNPTSDNLNIYIENADDYDMIRIVNINGELVYEQLVSESLNQISTADFSKGIYFVQIYSENGIVTEKIVKQ